MDPVLQQALLGQRPFIHTQWEKLLRLDHGNSALARPDTMVHLIHTTLDELFASFPLWSARRRASHTPAPVCPCGRSPYVAYYSAGRQALNESLIMIQAAMPELEAAARDEAFACLDQVFNRIAHRDIESFCSMCQFHPVRHRRGDNLAVNPDPTADSSLRR